MASLLLWLLPDLSECQKGLFQIFIHNSSHLCSAMSYLSTLWPVFHSRTAMGYRVCSRDSNLFKKHFLKAFLKPKSLNEDQIWIKVKMKCFLLFCFGLLGGLVYLQFLPCHVLAGPLPWGWLSSCCMPRSAQPFGDIQSFTSRKSKGQMLISWENWFF